MAVLDRPEDLLAAAAEPDARRARDAVAALTAPRLLEAVLTQASLAVEPGRVRPAGIDAVAELTRAAVEMTGVETPGVARGPSPAGADLPMVTGWELMTVGSADELVGATASVPVRPWFLAVIAFSDHPADRPAAPGAWRRVTAATADGRLVSARLRLGRAGDDGVLDARVSAEPGDLGADAALAWGLSRALAGAVRAV